MPQFYQTFWSFFFVDDNLWSLYSISICWQFPFLTNLRFYFINFNLLLWRVLCLGKGGTQAIRRWPSTICLCRSRQRFNLPTTCSKFRACQLPFRIQSRSHWLAIMRPKELSWQSPLIALLGWWLLYSRQDSRSRGFWSSCRQATLSRERRLDLSLGSYCWLSSWPHPFGIELMPSIVWWDLGKINWSNR